MNKKRGFTLIELLAVIVILAVIALIATPIIMNVIDDSKKGAAKDAMYGYVKAVELASAKQISPTTDAPDGDYITENGNLKQGSKLLEITFKGTKPENDGTIKISKGNVIEADLIFDGIPVHYNGKEVGELKKYAIGEEVYFDPTGTVTDCSSGKEWTPSNTWSTCYKWNVIKDNGTSVELLLDHNTTSTITWNSDRNSINGPKEVYNQLKIDTNGWSKAERLTSLDNATRVSANDTTLGTYEINYDGMRARLISGQEIANIIDAKEWNPTDSLNKINIEEYPWLYANTKDNGFDTDRGYWTDTAVTATSAYYMAFKIESDKTFGIENMGEVWGETIYGVRPVVRVQKSNI